MPVQDSQPADLVVRGSAVCTPDPARPWAQALAVRDGRIVVVGDEAEVAGVTGSRTRIVQAEGGMVMPGLADVHSHVGFGGQAAAWELGLSPAFGVEEILAAVRDRAGRLGPDEWVVGGIVISPVFHAVPASPPKNPSSPFAPFRGHHAAVRVPGAGA